MKRCAIKLVTWVGILFGILLVTATSLSLYSIYYVERYSTEESAPPTTAFVDTEHGTVAIRTWAGINDTTVILVGGLSAWGTTWESTVNEQRARGSEHTFVAIDLPPFGYSTANADTAYSRADQAERIRAVFESLNITSATVVGHSYGGGPIAEFALTSPSAVEHMILISPVLNLGAKARPVPHPLVTNDVVRHIAVAMVLPLKPLLLFQLKSFVHITDHISYTLLGMYTAPFTVDGNARRIANWLEVYLTDDVQSYKSTKTEAYRNAPFPITLLWGEEDTLTPLRDSEPLVQSGATLYPLTGIGHIPMIEDVTKFNDSLYTVLQQ